MPSCSRRIFIITANVMLLALLSACNEQNSRLSNGLSSTELPSPLTVAETIAANSGDVVCSTGGIRLVYGLDHNHDGKVGPYESIGTEYLCHPGKHDQNGPRVVTIGEGVPKADRQRLLDALSRS